MHKILDSPDTKTIFTLEAFGSTWFVDYNEVDTKENPNPYPFFVCRDEKMLRSFESFGEALAYIFDKQSTTKFQAVKVESNKLTENAPVQSEAINYLLDKLMEKRATLLIIDANYRWQNPNNPKHQIEVYASSLVDARKRIIAALHGIRIFVSRKDISPIPSTRATPNWRWTNPNNQDENIEVYARNSIEALGLVWNQLKGTTVLTVSGHDIQPIINK